MASTNPIILLLGAGGNTGLATAKKFYAEGWQVACVSRSEKDELKPYQSLFVQADFSEPNTIEAAFREVEQKLGVPSVVTYGGYLLAKSNLVAAYSATFGQTAGDLFAEISFEAYAKDLQVNATSNFAAIKLAIAGFKKLPSDALKTYIYIGNMCTGIVLPESITLGVGKNASLYTIECAAAAYGNLARWYFADERDPEGNSTMHKIDGEAHAEAFWTLTQDKQQRELNYTFVKGKPGYTPFKVDRASRPVYDMKQLLEIAEAKAGKS